MNILVVVDSWQGHTMRAVEHFAQGVREAGAEAVVKSADEAARADLLSSQALVMASAVHQRGMTWKMKRFVDEVCEPAWFYDDLVGRAGAVLTTGGGQGDAGGGSEMAQLGMLANLAACGMVLVPLPKCTPGFERAGMHWGPTLKTTSEDMAPLPPDQLDADALQAFFHHGVNVTRVAQRLAGLQLARGSRWPSDEVRAQRERSEANLRIDRRTPHPTDPSNQPIQPTHPTNPNKRKRP